MPNMSRILDTSVDSRILGAIERVINHLIGILDDTVETVSDCEECVLRHTNSGNMTNLGAGMSSLIKPNVWVVGIPDFSPRVKTSASTSKVPRIRESPISLKIGAVLKKCE